MKTGNLPAWWAEVIKSDNRHDMEDLMQAVNTAGVSPNDRTSVTRIWNQLMLVRLRSEQNLIMRTNYGKQRTK